MQIYERIYEPPKYRMIKEMKFIKSNGDIVEFSRDILLMNIFWKFCKPKQYYFNKLKALMSVKKEQKMIDSCVDYEITYFKMEL